MIAIIPNYIETNDYSLGFLYLTLYFLVLFYIYNIILHYASV